MTNNDQSATKQWELRGAPSHKGYIGLTMDLEERDRDHQKWARKRTDGKWASPYAWSRALRKHGREAFDLGVLETHLTEEAAKAAEIRCIAEHKTHSDRGGYNSTRGGDGVGGLAEEAQARKVAKLKVTFARPDIRASLRVRAERRWADAEYNARTSAANKDRWDDALRRRLAAIVKAASARSEVKARKAAANARPEYRASQSAKSKAYWTPEAKAPHSATLKAANANPEVMARKRAAAKASNTRPEYRARISVIKTADQACPEYRKRMSAIVKAASVDGSAMQSPARLVRLLSGYEPRAISACQARASSLNSFRSNLWGLLLERRLMPTPGLIQQRTRLAPGTRDFASTIGRGQGWLLLTAEKKKPRAMAGQKLV